MKQNFNQAGILETRPPGFSTGKVLEIVGALYGISGSISSLDSERDQNFLIDSLTGDQFVIKISNSAMDPAVLELQAAALEHIAKVDPDLPVPRVILSRNGLALEQIQDDGGLTHFVQVLTYISGRNPQDAPTPCALFRPLGACLARIALSLRGFSHPAATYELLWDLKQAAKLKAYLHHISDPEHHQLASHFLDRFERKVLPEIPKLRAQVVHNDFAPNNVVVAEDDPGKIVGIIDFGDLIHSLLVTDLATTIAQVLLGHDDPVEVAAEIIAAYHETIPLEPAEIIILYDLIAMRLTMLNIIATWRVTLYPENVEYIMGGVEQAWDMLEVWRALNPTDITKRFFRICGLWEMEEVSAPSKVLEESRQAHLNRRARLLGPCTYLFYERPLHIVRGEGVWLYDNEGHRYLDVYNNVAHVGHCHPHVVKAIADQARKLNTNTRYMHNLILELAEQITSRMPQPLSVCMFVCTGSEANELAWRMSKLVSGNNGALITRFSYHGNTDATIRFGTEEIPQEKLPTHVQTLYPPISNTAFRKPDSGITASIKTLADLGHRTAMLILDSGFTSDGIFTPPQGYLSMMYTETRAAGGLCVADEVQSGFGRLGQHFWGFEFNDVVPDIVTLGKPMGNGHPVAAVVTRPEIAEALAAETGYFNTYGGNPVSCAAGLAVLNVIEKEGLQQNALEVGDYLRERLLAIRMDHPVLGEPHGSGLLQGVDIVKPDGPPDPDLAGCIMNHMRHNGVLVGTTGPNNNVLKFRPPIIFNQEHSEILLASLKNALDEC
ncbi:aminotransferase class III-fold pyridoxal phosphate-dependent enzyme [Chloroflexota bacterium]